jgi:predicted CxxxxCH...CXXCH cytochrome family protein
LDSSITCDTCHSGAGSGTALHQNGASEVVIDTSYNAKTGAASFNATADTCSNVSCHGGHTTPVWLTGTIDVNTQCTSCHASGIAQYNSYNSGEHSRHVGRFTCTVCHDTTKLAVNHFTTLNTSAMEGPASATMVTDVNYNGTSCTPSCHSSQNW